MVGGDPPEAISYRKHAIFHVQSGQNKYEGAVDLVLHGVERPDRARRFRLHPDRQRQISVKLDCPMSALAICADAIEALMEEGFEDVPRSRSTSVELGFDHKGALPSENVIKTMIGDTYKLLWDHMLSEWQSR